MQEPCGVMVGVAENVQACLRIFWQPQHQWLVRDILHQPQGVFPVFVLLPPHDSQDQIRPIRLIRGRNSSRQPVLYGRGIAISILGEHLITGHHLLDLATVFALLKPKGGNKGKMHLLFGG